MRTPLYESHLARSAKMADFAGWDLPIQYAGIAAEHEACRTHAAVFDICHMGELIVEAEDVRRALDRAITCSFADLPDGGARYGFILADNGCILDDVITFVFDRSRAMVVTNAANTSRDAERLRAAMGHEASLRDASTETAKLDLQGPASQSVLGRLLGPDAASGLRFFRLRELDWRGARMIVSRTGYTGELGYELFVPSAMAVDLWDALLQAGEPEGLVPAGLGARDTLRLEASLPLYGHELDEKTTPIEAGLERFVSLDKAEDFPGKAALKRAAPPSRRLVGVKMAERSIPRAGYEVTGPGGQVVGAVTSGTLSPTLGYGVAMAYVPVELARPGTELAVRIRSREVRCEVVKMPFYKSPSIRGGK